MWFSSVQFSHSVMSNSLRPHESQHTRPPCPLPTYGVYSNKANGGDGIPAELFQILKDGAVKVLHSIYQQIWKPSSGPRTGKGQFSFQSKRRAMPKNVQTTVQSLSFHRLAR